MRNFKLSAFALVTLLLVLSAGPALAQVTVTIQGGQITISNPAYDTQDPPDANEPRGEPET